MGYFQMAAGLAGMGGRFDEPSSLLCELLLILGAAVLAFGLGLRK